MLTEMRADVPYMHISLYIVSAYGQRNVSPYDPRPDRNVLGGVFRFLTGAHGG